MSRPDVLEQVLNGTVEYMDYIQYLENCGHGEVVAQMFEDYVRANPKCEAIKEAEHWLFEHQGGFSTL